MLEIEGIKGDPGDADAKKQSDVESESQPSTLYDQPTGGVASSLFEDLPPSSSEKRKLEEGSSGTDEPEYKKKTKGSSLIHTRGYAAERKGERDEMQDAHVILDDLTQEFQNLSSAISRVAYYAVFDGHSGSKASKFAAENLHKILIAKFPKGDVGNRDREIKKCFMETFKKTDDNFLKEATASKPAWKDGSTAVCLLVVDDVLYIANLGDSKAILCRYNEEVKKKVAVPLTKDHTPTQAEERRRILKAGGFVREGRIMGVMEVSRSIGDGRFKHCGVISTPDVKRCQLTSNDRYLLVGCDGLWKAFTSDEAIKFIDNILQDESLRKSDTKTADDVRYEVACRRIASEAVRRKSADNVTVLLVHLQH
ncbi:integrin-linked kinase-associated serine/threonine phosphatase 2C-like isoform X2 [Ptychodera flava]|uniref:integrin-linked kinase-associated serine/threonine phosphatase 2C-like isoform X2 n=1 Tax=Ptychodera flava TaxID=63121 RepID=UPI003969E1CD